MHQNQRKALLMNILATHPYISKLHKSNRMTKGTSTSLIAEKQDNSQKRDKPKHSIEKNKKLKTDAHDVFVLW